MWRDLQNGPPDCNSDTIGKHLQVFVRDNNVEQALKVLKRKMQREGVFREMKRRKAYEKPSERKTREKTEPSDACGRPPGNRLSAKVYSRCLNAGKMHAVLLRGPGRSEFSASSTALDRTRPTSAHQINLQMSPRRITGSPDSRSLTSWIRFAAGTGGYMSALWYAEAPKSRQAPSHSCPGMIGGTDRVTNDWSRDPGPGHLPQVLLTTNSVRRELVGLKDALHRPQADPRRPSQHPARPVGCFSRRRRKRQIDNSLHGAGWQRLFVRLARLVADKPLHALRHETRLPVGRPRRTGVGDQSWR